MKSILETLLAWADEKTLALFILAAMFLAVLLFGGDMSEMQQQLMLPIATGILGFITGRVTGEK